MEKYTKKFIKAIKKNNVTKITIHSFFAGKELKTVLDDSFKQKWNVAKELNETILDLKHSGYLSPKNLSDEWHTFDDLYYHRMVLTASLLKVMFDSTTIKVGKSKNHHPDGDDMFPGSFIVWAELPSGMISYHYNLEHWDKFLIPEFDHAIEWDGHNADDTIDRMLETFALIKNG